MIIHYDPDTGLMLQFEGFFDRKRIDPEVIASTDRSMQVVLGIEGANESQVIKQADVIMLLCLLRDEYDAQTWQTNWDTYMPITDHRYGSSLGPSFHAWAACEMDQPGRGLRSLYAGGAGRSVRCARQCRRRYSRGLGGRVVAGGGLRVRRAARSTVEGLSLKPHLPAHWQQLAFCVRYRGDLYRVDIRQGGETTIVRRASD